MTMLRNQTDQIHDLGASEMLSSLEVVATPWYPIVFEGQSVNLHCRASTHPPSVNWSWHRLDNQKGWQEVDTRRDLTLTKAEESGQYHCCASSSIKGVWQEEQSTNHTVYIIPLPKTVGDKLGEAAFYLSLLACIILFTFALWHLCPLVWQRLNGGVPLQSLTATNNPAKGSGGPAKAPTGSLVHSRGAAEVYMNYTSSSKAYADLDPNCITEENAYSILS
ncbi:uncharacterized protein LOC130126579 [Lampris incognitus]|uniref:uncharacterized protein LOC130126579 n=1 Tax=Lampris incognitus TaxID=2546036 RepID=UPI0024B4FBC0|nr:uncharacterized protein LOC130126579 [Lampris incognitus]